MIPDRASWVPTGHHIPRDNTECMWCHTLSDHCVSGTKIQVHPPPKKNCPWGHHWQLLACWADVFVGQASKKFKPRNSSMCAKFFKPRDKGSVEQNLRKGRGPETNGVSLSPFYQLLGVLRDKELSRTDMKANDTALNLLVCPSVPVRLSKHLLGFPETTETTNQHDGSSGPLPSHPGPLPPRVPGMWGQW